MMYVINVWDVHREIMESLCSLTKVVYSPTAVLLDITDQVMHGICPAVPGPMCANVLSLYSRERKNDALVDERILADLYKQTSPIIKEKITSYFQTGIDFDLAFAIKAGSILVLTGDEIAMFEGIYGSKNIRRLRGFR